MGNKEAVENRFHSDKSFGRFQISHRKMQLGRYHDLSILFDSRLTFSEISNSNSPVEVQSFYKHNKDITSIAYILHP